MMAASPLQRVHGESSSGRGSAHPPLSHPAEGARGPARCWCSCRRRRRRAALQLQVRLEAAAAEAVAAVEHDRGLERVGEACVYGVGRRGRVVHEMGEGACSAARGALLQQRRRVEAVGARSHIRPNTLTYGALQQRLSAAFILCTVVFLIIAAA